MGIFSGLFKKKEAQNVVQQNAIDENQIANGGVPQGAVGETVEPMETSNEPAPIVIDQSNVLEQMQNNFAIESAKEAEESGIEEDPMSVFNQNITLDNNNPMAIFGADSEDNKQ